MRMAKLTGQDVAQHNNKDYMLGHCAWKGAYDVTEFCQVRLTLLAGELQSN